MSFEGRLGFLYHPSYQWAIRVSQIDPLELGATVFEAHLIVGFYLTSVYILPLRNDSVAVILARLRVNPICTLYSQKLSRKVLKTKICSDAVEIAQGWDAAHPGS